MDDWGLGDLWSGASWGDAGWGNGWGDAGWGDLGGAWDGADIGDAGIGSGGGIDWAAMGGDGSASGGGWDGSTSGGAWTGGDGSASGGGWSGGGGASGGSGGSWWSDAARYAQPLLGGLGGAALGAVGNYLAGQQRSDASTRAAQLSANASTQAAQIAADALARSQALMREATARGTDAINSGYDRFEQTMAPLTTARPIMLPTNRGLTDAEQIARGDIRRNALATLAATGLRGAGRAVSQTVMDADRRFVANATQTNDNRRLAAMQDASRRADSATASLATARQGRGQALANIEIGQGNRVAGTEGQIGATQGAGVQQAGAAMAQDASNQGTIASGEITANTMLGQDALGALGSVIADSMKSSNREKYSATDRMV